VHINTGDLVRRLRAQQSGPVAGGAWKLAAGHWRSATAGAAVALTAADRLPPAVPTALTRAGRSVLGAEQVPLYSDDLPRGGRPRPHARSGNAEAVFFASCIGRMFGPEPRGGAGVTDALVELSQRAGVALRTPDALDSLCCGTPWKSKGHRGGYAMMAGKVTKALLDATEGGRLPVIADAASCTQGLLTMARSGSGESLVVVDATDFVATHLLDRLTVSEPVASIALHPTCSSAELGSTVAMEALARFISPDVYVPVAWGCCAFAGDRGMLHPQLTASATAPEAAELSTKEFAAYASCNRTCEIAMTRATGKPYRHILELLEGATRSESAQSGG
jgi:D-lactate dehydrogenase